METLHIIDNRSRTQLLSELLSDNNALIKHRFTSFDHVFYDEFNPVERKLIAIETVKKNLDSFDLLKGYLEHRESALEALRFLDLLDRYQIDLSSLPTDSKVDQEKTKLIHLLAQQVERVYLKRKTVTNPIVVHPFYQELYHKQFIEEPLIKKKEPTITFKTALNMRQEVSGVKAYIDNHNHESILILVGNEEYHPILKQQIPSAQFLNEKRLDSIFLAYFYLMKAFKNQDKEALINYFSLNLNNDKEMRNFLDVVERYQPDFDELVTGLSEKNFSENNVIKENVIDEQTSYGQARDFSLKLATKLSEIDQNNLFTSIFNFLATNNASSYQLKNSLEDNYALTTRFDLMDVLELTLLNERPITQTHSNIVISDFQYQPSTTFDTIIYLGLTSSNFPKPNELTGLYNERYAQKIESFPSLSARLTFHINQLTKNFNISDKLILSYPQMDYLGKPHQVAFEIEQITNKEKPTLWQFPESQGHSSVIGNLDREIAEKLFLDENKNLIGSVSSLEAYTKNSYKYFIERGLNIRSKQKLELDPAVVGTLSHYVLETLVRNKGSFYTASTISDIEELLNPTFNQLIKIFPKQKTYLELSLKRLSLNLFNSIKEFSEYENIFKPTVFEQEKRFSKAKLFEHVPILMNGFVDRIDFVDVDGEENIVVIDYKSSSHSLSVNKILNGRQLQLPIYGLLLKKELEKGCLSLSYFLMNHGLSSISSFKLNSTTYDDKPQYPTKSDKLVHRYLKQPNKPGISKPRATSMLDEEKLEAYFEKLMLYLYNNIASGILDEFSESDDYFDFNNTQRNQETFGSYEDLYLRVDPTAIIVQE